MNIKSTTFYKSVKYQSETERRLENEDSCVIYSLSIALKQNIETTHDFCKKYLGYTKHGCSYRRIISTLGVEYEVERTVRKHFPNVKSIEGFYPRNPVNMRKATVNQVLNDDTYSKGRYLIMVRGHMFTYIDGVIIGNERDSKRLKCPIIAMLEVTLK